MNTAYRSLLQALVAVSVLVWVTWAAHPYKSEAWASSSVLEEKADDTDSKEGENEEEKEEEAKESAPQEKPVAEQSQKDAEKKEAEASDSDKEKPSKQVPTAEQPKPAAEPAPQAPAAKPSPTTHTVKRGLVKVEKSYNAVFQPKALAEFVLRFQVWSQAEVLEAVEHGARVKKGDVLVRFKTEDLDRAIADQKRSLEAARRALKDAEELLAITEKSVPFDLESLRMSLEQAEQDTKRYFEVERELLIRNYEMSLRSSKESLDYERAELEQLEKMYKADDLTEETEELILRRQRFAVERAELSFLLAQDRHERFMKIQLPRDDEALKRDLERIKLITARSQISLPALLVEQRRAVEQQKIDLERAEERLAKLEADRKLLDCRASCDGVAYYGAFNRGEWSGASILQSKLKPGGSVSKNDVLFTIVQLPTEKITFSVGEADIRWIEAGLEGTVEPKSRPRTFLPVVVSQVADVPIAADKFEVTAEVTMPKRALGLVPSMTGTARFLVYVKKDAVLVPSKAVFTEELDPAQRYVWVKGEGDRPEKRSVEVGESTGDSLEILDGLREGEIIFLEKPKTEE
ncbi:MAG: hypothetical protein Kow0040_19430 [Thermogutta sp.]